MMRWQQLAPLCAGDRVGIVAPGGALNRADFEAGLVPLRAMGLTPVYDAHVFAKEGYFAGSDELRASQLLWALQDTSLRAIWAARGGYGSARLLPGLDVAEIARSGKWLVGFSDISALHCMWAQAGLHSLHAITVNKLATWQPEALKALQSCLMARQALTLRGEGALGAPAVVRGRLFGGNLTVLASLAGTGFLPSWQGGVVCLEDVGEAPYRLHRVATQLMQAGAFAGVRAVVIGQLTDCPPTPAGQAPRPYAEVAQALADVFVPLQVPVVWGVPVGHAATSWPLPLGLMATLDVATCTLTVDPVA
jgi:muramoyltetrapeptide carboxypeptidase